MFQTNAMKFCVFNIIVQLTDYEMDSDLTQSRNWLLNCSSRLCCHQMT